MPFARNCRRQKREATEGIVDLLVWVSRRVSVIGRLSVQ